MLHYNLHFNINPRVDKAVAISTIDRFLESMCDTAEISDYQLLENQGAGEKSKLQRYQAIIEFRDREHFSTAMAKQAKLGIHTGLHGEVTRMVSNFHAEFFETLNPAEASCGPCAI